MARNRIYYYNRRVSRKKGKRDGRTFTWRFWPFLKNEKIPYPLIDQYVPAQFEDELLTLGLNEIDEVNEAWKQKDKQVKTNYCLAKNERHLALLQFQAEESDVAPEEANVEEITEELMNHPSAPITHRTALVFHFLVFVGEVFFNAIVFNIFGFEIWESYIVAAVLGIAISLLAYFFGKLLKKQEKTPIENGLVYTIPVIGMAVIVAISRSQLNSF